MDIDLIEFLTEKQKEEVTEVYKNKLIEAINGIPITKVRKLILEDIKASFENEYFLEGIDGAAIGKAITAKIKDAI